MENPTFKEVFMNLSVDELHKLILQHPKIVNCSLFTEEDAHIMEGYYQKEINKTEENENGQQDQKSLG